MGEAAWWLDGDEGFVVFLCEGEGGSLGLVEQEVVSSALTQRLTSEFVGTAEAHAAHLSTRQHATFSHPFPPVDALLHSTAATGHDRPKRGAASGQAYCESWPPHFNGRWQILSGQCLICWPLPLPPA